LGIFGFSIIKIRIAGHTTPYGIQHNAVIKFSPFFLPLDSIGYIERGTTTSTTHDANVCVVLENRKVGSPLPKRSENNLRQYTDIINL
jgi:hypothetical protein